MLLFKLGASSNVGTTLLFKTETGHPSALYQLDARSLHLLVFLGRCKEGVVEFTEMTGNELLRVLGTLANPHRLRVLAALAHERDYVSSLARSLGISRALLQVHLRKLEAAGLVSAAIEVSEDGKAMKFYEVAPFALNLTPQSIMIAARSLDLDGDAEVEAQCFPAR